VAADGAGSEPFTRSLAAAVGRADRESIDEIGTLLARQVAALQGLGRLLHVNYQWVYEHEQDGWLQLTLYAEALYQQLHAALTTAAIMIGEVATPPLRVRGLAQLRDTLDADGAHPLGPRLRTAGREVGLLRWFATVRNKAVQHRAEAGYLGGRAVVMQDGFALLHRTEPVDRATIRKAHDLFAGMTRRYGRWNTDPVASSEMIVYLDLASHELFPLAPHEFDQCQRIVREAHAHNLVVSLPVLENLDAALAALIELAPLRPTALSKPGR
jgi:hypothetical protein